MNKIHIKQYLIFNSKHLIIFISISYDIKKQIST